MGFIEDIQEIKVQLSKSKTAPEIAFSGTVLGSDYVYVFINSLGETRAVTKDNLLNGVGSGTEDGNDTPINQGDAIEDVAPTALQVPSPENGDTASKYLTSAKLEKWLYTTSWAKVWVLSVPEGFLIDGTNDINSTFFNLRRNLSGPAEFLVLSGNDPLVEANTTLIFGFTGISGSLVIDQNSNTIQLSNDAGNGTGFVINDTPNNIDVQASYVQLLDSTVPDMEAAPGIALPTKDWVESKITGASGSFTASGQTITVVDGLITNIV